MRAGKLRHRITIKRKSVTGSDSYGAESFTESTIATRWAEVRPLLGRELFNARQTQADVTHAIKTRWIDGLSPKDWIVYDGRTFEILAVTRPDERKIEAVYLAKERV